ncbi:MAG: hypothetical protein PHO30_05690 [Candidatus Omnitrophica bacterium]|nr:hypothetical protein [Candidatus Omnitrophota bacterium]
MIKRPIFIGLVSGIILFSLSFFSFAGSLSWYCDKCGQTFQFDPRDSAYRDSFIQNHMASHGSSAGAQPGSYSDQAAMGLMQQVITGYQQGLEQQRQQQLEEQQSIQRQLLEKQRLQEEQNRIESENRQRKQQEFRQSRDDLLNQLSGSGNESLGFRDISSSGQEKYNGKKEPPSTPKTKPTGISLELKTASFLETGAALKSAGYPIVPYDKLGLLDPADLKAFIAGLSKDDLNKLDRYLKQKKSKLTGAIEQVKEKETRAVLGGYTPADYQLWTQAVKDKVMDDVPLARTMESLGQKAGGADVDIANPDFAYKNYGDAEKLSGHLTESKGAAEVDAAMAYVKFTEADNFREGAIAAMPYAGEAMKKMMPEPSELAKYGDRTVKIAEKGSTVIDVMEQVSDIGYRGMDMHIFNEGLKQEKTANKVLAIELRSQKENFIGRLNETKMQEKLVTEELNRR